MRFASLLLVLVSALPLAAQPLFSGVFDSPVVSFGGTVVLNLTATEPIGLSNGCGYVAIHALSPGGPIVSAPFICPLIFITVGPNQSWSIRWNGTDRSGVQVPAGTYYIEVFGGTIANGTQVRGFFPVRIDDPAQPTPPVLIASVAGSGLPRVPAATGGIFDCTIQAPSEPFGIYFVAASATTNVGQSFPPFFIGLDFDLVFSLSFPTPLPGIFNGFLGALDAGGQGGGIQVVLPPGALPAGFPLALQAVIVGSGAPVLTNVQTLATL